MRMLILIWLFLMAGGFAALLLRRDSGYALLSWDVWTVEMSMAMLLVLMLLFFTAVYLLLRLVAHSFELPLRLREWRQKRQRRRAQQALTRGLLQLAEGEWENSEHSLVLQAERSEAPLLNYLSAARAAQLQGAYDRRDAYIRLAHQHMPSADVAVSLTQAELQLANQQLEQALATLKHLRSIAPKHHYVLRLLSQLYEQLGEWGHLLEILPELHRHQVLSDERLLLLEIKTHTGLLNQAVLTDSLQQAWSQLPKKLKHNQQLLFVYASHLHQMGQDEAAEPLLRQSIEKAWDEKLILMYGMLDGTDFKRQLKVTESLLEQQPTNPVLLLTLGRLSLKDRLWGKAKNYLESSIDASGPIESYHELGNLLENMNKPEAALAVYRNGIGRLGTVNTVSLPKNLGRIAAVSIDK